MRQFLIRLTVASALALPIAVAPTLVNAQAGGQSNDCVRAHERSKTCKKIDFQKGSNLEGTTPTGTGEDVSTTKEVTHSNLIKLRWSFYDKILRTGNRI